MGTEFVLKISGRSASGLSQDLQAEIAPYATVSEPAAKAFDPMSIILAISVTANVLQIADILGEWLKRKGRGNQAEIRLSDGTLLKLEANGDVDAFIKKLKAVLK